MAQQDERIAAAIDRDRARLGRFIASRVPDPGDAEDILQDVFFELVEAYRLMRPVEQVTAWLFQVARNRIVDLFRRRAREVAAPPSTVDKDAGFAWEDTLPDGGEGDPEAALVRSVAIDALVEALEELPPEQREVFVAHELEGESFKALSERLGVGVNTLLGRKRYAVLHLRERLKDVYTDLMEG